jgi:hypothetical protein
LSTSQIERWDKNLLPPKKRLIYFQMYFAEAVLTSGEKIKAGTERADREGRPNFFC